MLLGATVTVALLVAPVFSTGGDHDVMDMGEKPAMESMEDKAAMDLEKSMEGMDADAHDHEKVMEKAGVAVGIEEKLGNMLTDAEFLDSEGNSVNLLELTKDVPTILIPIYYRCPDVCNVDRKSVV